MSVSSLYEVRCDGCEVSFPPGTKTCLHCGGRLGKRRTQAPPRPIMRGQLDEGIARSDPPELRRTLADFQAGPGSEDEPESSGPRRAIRLGVNFLWILGAIVITGLQMCRGG